MCTYIYATVNYNVLKQALKVHETMGWGLLQFDERMATWMANSKRTGKSGIKRQVPEDFQAAADEQEASESETDGKRKSTKKRRREICSPKVKQEQKKLKSKKVAKKKTDDDASASDSDDSDNSVSEERILLTNQSKISFLGQDNKTGKYSVPMAHGRMIDSEPELPGTRTQSISWLHTVTNMATYRYIHVDISLHTWSPTVTCTSTYRYIHVDISLHITTYRLHTCRYITTYMSTYRYIHVDISLQGLGTCVLLRMTYIYTTTMSPFLDTSDEIFSTEELEDIYDFDSDKPWHWPLVEFENIVKYYITFAFFVSM